MNKGHVPIRQCVVCKRRIEKHGLKRFVRTPSGWVADPAGTAFGRGAYVCSPECMQGLKKNKRYRALADA